MQCLLWGMLFCQKASDLSRWGFYIQQLILYPDRFLCFGNKKQSRKMSSFYNRFSSYNSYYPESSFLKTLTFELSNPILPNVPRNLWIGKSNPRGNLQLHICTQHHLVITKTTQNTSSRTSECTQDPNPGTSSTKLLRDSVTCQTSWTQGRCEETTVVLIILWWHPLPNNKWVGEYGQNNANQKVLNQHGQESLLTCRSR